MDSVKLREILVEVAQGGAKVLADPEVFECAVNSGHEDIMSALKRVPGAVVKELSWEECRLAQKPRWQAQAFMRQYYEIDYDEEYAAQGIAYYVDPLDDTFPTLEAAKAACQADYAKRITSAVEPSCVVTDDMVEAAWSAFVGAGEDWRDGAVRRRDDLDKAALKAALTAALSSRTEEDVELARLREALTPSCETKAAYMGEFSFLIDDYDEDGEEHSRKITVPWDTVKEIMAFIRARSLTNGGE